MILQLASRHCRKIARFYIVLFYLTIVLQASAANTPVYRIMNTGIRKYIPPHSNRFGTNAGGDRSPKENHASIKKQVEHKTPKHNFIGGPSQPEMSSFKSVSADKLVNLFTGDFSYNIPLLDVGGYPVNIYYDGGITPDQEASWVGLGWNINPGNINRNMRGIPDDFNGQDTLEQVQTMKPNRSWGLSTGADLEGLGIKLPVKGEVGVGFNNYLGPSLSAGIRGSVSLFKITTYGGSEKLGGALGANVEYGIEVNSRSGTSFTGKVSLTGNAHYNYNNLTAGIGVSTGYNSRSGLKALQISEQFKFNNDNQRKSKLLEALAWRGTSGTLSTSITFAKPSYTPTLRMPVTNTAWTSRVQVGGGGWGLAVDLEAEVYGQKTEVHPSDVVQKKPMVGYLYYQNAVNNANYVMDFTRFNDREVTPNTPVISAPQYCYDVFSIQGEGTGGNIRAYRNDLGYVRDNITTSKDKNWSLGADVDPYGHYGANLSIVKTPSTIGEWNKGNKLRNVIGFTSANETFENVYFRNPGEACVIDATRFNQIGGTNLVRFELGGSGQSPTIEPRLQAFNADGQPLATPVDLKQQPVIQQRNKRTQVINFLKAQEAAEIGLDKVIKSYDNQVFLDAVTDTLLYETIQRVSGYRKAHHISQINVTESDGKRYIYGIPVYNIKQKDFTFSVDNSYAEIPDKVTLNNTNQASAASSLLNDNSGRDGYVQISTTPAYAHSFLLSGLLSSDYVDVTGNGITEDDLGDAVKFNYTKIKNGTDMAHKWRTPLTTDNAANFNAGLRSEVKDDKGIISYGERESWYLHSVESKTMIALFYVSNRSDGKGTTNEFGGTNSSNLLKKLDSIALFSKADLKKNGLTNAKAIKTVHFDYSYLLCQNTPDNTSAQSGSKGKLTLQNIYFTYNGKTRVFKNKYSFSYSSTGTDNSADNPGYEFAAADRWGTYKPQSLNPGGMKNSDYPYSIQQAADTTTIDKNASAWMLKKIVLPSGGQIEVNYESDDYAWVQNKRAAVMMPVAGFGSTSSFSSASNRLYPFVYPLALENDYVFMQVPEACSTAADVYNKYLQGLSQLAFKIWIQMPKGPEYIPCYANFDTVANTDYGVDATNANRIWVKMKRVGGKSPLSITTLEYLRQQLPGQAFKGYDVSGEPPLRQVGDMLLGMLYSLRDAFTDPINAFRQDGKAQLTDLSKCFVRLNDVDGIKYGGGHRVKSVIVKDNWNAMTGQYTATYGQQYKYTTTEKFGGAVRTISSGVASYEPSVGGEENPWQSITQIEDELPLGPTSYGAVEMPVLDAFFPAPGVGYSKVTVSSIKTNTDTTKKSRSGIGRQVTEFYTAKDFPVYYSYTPFDAASVKEFHQNSTSNFFNKYGYDYKAQSQGFVVAVNDMHGKMKSQSSYAENDTATRVNYTENFYRNTGVNGMNDQFSFINRENGGTVSSGNMGIDIELMTDAREFSVKGSSYDHQAQVDLFFFVIATIPVPTYWRLTGTTENIYRAVTTTKYISYHAVLDSVVVIDKGSQVSTKNLAYDEHTGEVLVSRTNNEFNRPVYNTSYPAYWAYSGMGLAYKNIDAAYSNINFSDGKITKPGFDFSVFESGDELYIISPGGTTSCPAPSAATVKLIWAVDKNKNTTSLTNPTPDFIFLDEKGKPYSRTGVTFRIIRSGCRNMLDARTATLVNMVNPLATGKLLFDSTSKVINASAIEFKEKWQTDNDVFKRYNEFYNPATCTFQETEDPGGYLEQSINPYRKGLLGNFRSWRSMVFYDGRMEYDTTANTNITENGFLKNFKLYWYFNTSNNLVPDTYSNQWVWNSKLNRVNTKGRELETMDALGIYTAAQYGYNKTLPVAITNNARYDEMFAEGFEDYGYGESLSNAQFTSYAKKHIDFSNLSGSFLVNTDTTGFKAHSGKYVLGINAGRTLAKSISVQSSPADAFDLVFNYETTKTLANPGGNAELLNETPHSYYGWYPSFQNLDNWVQVVIPYTDPALPQPGPVQYGFRTQQYFEVTQGGTFHFTTLMSYTVYGGTLTDYGTHTDIGIYDIGRSQHVQGFTKWLQTGTEYVADYSICLPPGLYLITCTYGLNGSYDCENNGSNACTIDYNASTVFDNKSLTGYKDVTTVNGCTYTKPVAATNAMQNPVCTVPAGKKMLFSAWVRENCGNATNGIPCRENTYTHNQVQLNFPEFPDSVVILNPSGPIIDGWQRVEGEFTAPAGATGMTLNLVNSGTSPVYFDDIRIHPFNANMKSYVYDPVNLRLVAELDGNNYARFYEYDEEGTPIRTKAETRDGIKTITETRSALQKVIQ